MPTYGYESTKDDKRCLKSMAYAISAVRKNIRNGKYPGTKEYEEKHNKNSANRQK